MKQTSVEWLENELKKLPLVNVIDVFKQAKEMEKQQIIDAAERWKGTDFAEKYYAETYGSKGSDELSKVAENTSFDTSSPTEISDEEFDALLKQVIEVQNLAMYSDISEDYRQGYLDGIKWLYSKLKQK